MFIDAGGNKSSLVPHLKEKHSDRDGKDRGGESRHLGEEPNEPLSISRAEDVQIEHEKIPEAEDEAEQGSAREIEACISRERAHILEVGRHVPPGATMIFVVTSDYNRSYCERKDKRV